MPSYHVVIREATIADGTGAGLRTGDLAITGDRIAAVGEVDGPGTREIDADGALVAPGCVDVHTHYDGQAVWDTNLASSSTNGVTSVVLGNCGVGFAPVRPNEHDTLINLMEGVEDIPGTALHEGLTWEWQTFPEYLDALEQLPHDIDFAAQVPYAALRVYVMGDRGVNLEPATPADTAAMAALAQEAIMDGALGFTTSRTINHRSSTGLPTPSLRAELEELAGIAGGLGEVGRGVVQLVSDFEHLDDEWPIIMAMAQAGRPLSMTMAENFGINPRDDAPDGAAVLNRISEARAEGIEISAQVAVRPIGLTLGLAATLHPFMSCPEYQRIAHLPLSERVALLRNGPVRDRLIDTYAGEIDSQKIGGTAISRFHQMVRLGDPPDYEPAPEAMISAIASRRGITPQEVALDFLLEDDGRGLLYIPLIGYAQGNLDSARAMLLHPYAVPGLSDGGAHVGTVCDVTFPTYLLSHWGRDRATGRMPIEFLVERHTRAAARLVDLHDRGVLARGYRADVNVIDFDNLKLQPPRTALGFSCWRASLQTGRRRIPTYVRRWRGDLCQRAIDRRITREVGTRATASPRMRNWVSRNSSRCPTSRRPVPSSGKYDNGSQSRL